MQSIGYAELLAWAVYLGVRNNPERPWIRDGTQAADMAAAYYGG